MDKNNKIALFEGQGIRQEYFAGETYFSIVDIIKVLEENSELLTEGFANEIKDIIVEGVNIETAYNKDLFPNGILGLNADYVNQYVQYVADRRLTELGLPKQYNVTNPAKWMSTATDVLELVNFFEQQNPSRRWRLLLQRVSQ
jgi:ribonucleoside-diphosphate reductase beta chain